MGRIDGDGRCNYVIVLLLRNMASPITSDPDSQAIASAFAGRLSATIKPGENRLYQRVEEVELSLLAACHGQSLQPADQPAETRVSLTDSQRDLVHLAMRERRMEPLRASIKKRTGGIETGVIAYAVPLVARDCSSSPLPGTTSAGDTRPP